MQASLNHMPLIRRNVLPSHASFGDTADPFLGITCPECRRMLEQKVEAHRAKAEASKSRQQSEFFSADADHWQAVLDQ